MGEDGTGVVARNSDDCLSSPTSSVVVFFPRFLDDAFLSTGWDDDVSFSGLDSWLFGVLRSPSTFFEVAAALVDFFLPSKSSTGLSAFSSRTTSDDAVLDDAFVVRVERVERVAFLTGMAGQSSLLILNARIGTQTLGVFLRWPDPARRS